MYLPLATPAGPLILHLDQGWRRVRAPTPDAPDWHDDSGTRLAYRAVLAHAGDRREEVRDLHAEAISEIVSCAQALDERGDRRAARRMAAAAARLAGEIAGPCSGD
jgi:hypothetical protein